MRPAAAGTANSADLHITVHCWQLVFLAVALTAFWHWWSEMQDPGIRPVRTRIAPPQRFVPQPLYEHGYAVRQPFAARHPVAPTEHTWVDSEPAAGISDDGSDNGSDGGGSSGDGGGDDGGGGGDGARRPRRERRRRWRRDIEALRNVSSRRLIRALHSRGYDWEVLHGAGVQFSDVSHRELLHWLSRNGTRFQDVLSRSSLAFVGLPTERLLRELSRRNSPPTAGPRCWAGYAGPD